MVVSGVLPNAKCRFKGISAGLVVYFVRFMLCELRQSGHFKWKLCLCVRSLCVWMQIQWIEMDALSLYQSFCCSLSLSFVFSLFLYKEKKKPNSSSSTSISYWKIVLTISLRHMHLFHFSFFGRLCHSWLVNLPN